MAFYLGSNNAAKFYVGSDEVQKLYLGSVLVEINEMVAGPAPFLSEFSVAEANEVGTLNVQVNDDATLYVWIGPTGTTPTAQEIKNGTGADASSSLAVTMFGGPYFLTLPDTLNGNYRVSVVAQVGSGPLSNVLTQSPVAFDTTPMGLMAESVFFVADTNYGANKSFQMPTLAPGNYIIFYTNGENPTKAADAITLAGRPATFEDAYFRQYVRVEAWTVTIDGTETNNALFMEAPLSNYHGLEVIRVGSGVIQEIVKSTSETVTLTDTQPGMALHPMFTTSTGGWESSNTPILNPHQQVATSRSYVSGYLLDIPGGSSTILAHNHNSAFRYYAALGIKLIDGNL